MKYVIALCLFGLAYASNPACRLQPETGMCRAYIPSYYYDAETGQCKQFIYGGCGGNDNRFSTEEKCKQSCDVQETNVEICHLEPEAGLCLAYIPRYYYNAKEGKCEKFIYGGCQGNPNNFKTLEECEAKCGVQKADVPVCEQEAETGMCRGYFPRYHYDQNTGECKRFIYGGCGGNQNNFKSEDECLQTCAAHSAVPVCEQDAEPGRCLAYIPKYYYNKKTGECERFIYGGCGGNDNRFSTKEECEDTCQVIEEAQSTCELEPETGLCRGYFPRYYFNKDSGKCEKFVYGGCDGNANNFETEEECQKECGVQSAEAVCEQEKESGLCDAYFPRYFFNKETGRCERFIYGGCGGNGNNFRTVEECERTCGAF